MTLTRTRRNAPEANEEWPELIQHGKVGEVRKVKLAPATPEPRQIGLSSVSAADLRSMKKKDPFLYYSIPQVRSSKLLGQEIDVSDLGTCRIRSCPSRLLSAPWRAPPSKQLTATRSKRISFECHPELLLEDLTISEGIEDEQDDDFEDPLDIILAAQAAALK